MRVSPRQRGDAGFTLVELVVAIVLLGIIAVPLGSALLSFFRNTNATSDRLAESHDAQISSAYFGQDVQSIGVRNWSNPAGHSSKRNWRTLITNGGPLGFRTAGWRKRCKLICKP